MTTPNAERRWGRGGRVLGAGRRFDSRPYGCCLYVYACMCMAVYAFCFCWLRLIVVAIVWSSVVVSFRFLFLSSSFFFFLLLSFRVASSKPIAEQQQQTGKPQQQRQNTTYYRRRCTIDEVGTVAFGSTRSFTHTRSPKTRLKMQACTRGSFFFEEFRGNVPAFSRAYPIIPISPKRRYIRGVESAPPYRCIRHPSACENVESFRVFAVCIPSTC